MTITAWTTYPYDVTESMKQILARRDRDIFQTGGIDPALGYATWATEHALNADIRARAAAAGHPIKTGIYAWGPGGVQGESPAYPWITDAMCLHRLDGSVIHAPDPPQSPANPDGGPLFKMVNLGSSDVRMALVNRWVAWMQGDSGHHAPYDILILDNLSFGPQGHAFQTLRLAGLGGTQEAGTQPLGWYWWWSALAQYMVALRNALEAVGKILLVNGVSPQGYDPTDVYWASVGPDFVNLADYATGVLSETPHQIWQDPLDQLPKHLTMWQRVLDKTKQLLICWQMGLIPAGGQQVENFAIGVYKLIDRPGLTSFSYHDGAPYQGLLDPVPSAESAPYVWDRATVDHLDLGAPLSTIQTGGPIGLYWRRFERGAAIVNPTNAAISITLWQPMRAWHPTTGDLLNPGPWPVAAKSGWVLHYV